MISPYWHHSSACAFTSWVANFERQTAQPVQKAIQGQECRRTSQQCHVQPQGCDRTIQMSRVQSATLHMYACCVCREVADTENSVSAWGTFIQRQYERMWTSMTLRGHNNWVNSWNTCWSQVEAELQELEEEEALEYLQSLGVEEGGLRSLIAATYKQLGLLTYFTTGRSISLFRCAAFPAGAVHIAVTPSKDHTVDLQHRNYQKLICSLSVGFWASRALHVAHLRCLEYTWI